MFCFFFCCILFKRPPRTLSSSAKGRTLPSQDLSQHATYRRLSGRGLLDAADLGGEGGEVMTNDPRGDDDIDDVRPRPPHTTINLFNKEKDGGRLLWTQIFKGGMVMPPTRRRSGQLRLGRRRSG
jgi:hypothetical protein